MMSFFKPRFLIMVSVGTGCKFWLDPATFKKSEPEDFLPHKKVIVKEELPEPVELGDPIPYFKRIMWILSYSENLMWFQLPFSKTIFSGSWTLNDYDKKRNLNFEIFMRLQYFLPLKPYDSYRCDLINTSIFIALVQHMDMRFLR